MPTVDPADFAICRRRTLDWARSYARRQPWWIDRDLLENVAEHALLQAVERFDPARGYRFSTYAVPWVKGCVKRAVRDQIPGTRGSRVDFVSIDASVESLEGEVTPVYGVTPDFSDGADWRVALPQLLARLEPREREALLAKARGENQHVTARRLRTHQMAVSRLWRSAAAKVRAQLCQE